MIRREFVRRAGVVAAAVVVAPSLLVEARKERAFVEFVEGKLPEWAESTMRWMEEECASMGLVVTEVNVAEGYITVEPFRSNPRDWIILANRS